MKGIKALIGRNKAYTFNYFDDRKKAIEWIKEQLEIEGIMLNQNTFDIKIEEIELSNCPACDRFIEVTETLCLRCDEMRMDL
jgi:hypothetical protein